MFISWGFGFFGSFPKKVIISKSEGLDEKGVNSGYSECTFLKGCIRADIAWYKLLVTRGQSDAISPITCIN